MDQLFMWRVLVTLDLVNIKLNFYSDQVPDELMM